MEGYDPETGRFSNGVDSITDTVKSSWRGIKNWFNETSEGMKKNPDDALVMGRLSGAAGFVTAFFATNMFLTKTLDWGPEKSAMISLLVGALAYMATSNLVSNAHAEERVAYAYQQKNGLSKEHYAASNGIDRQTGLPVGSSLTGSGVKSDDPADYEESRADPPPPAPAGMN